MTLRLNTIERFQLLSHLVDDVPDANGGEVLRSLSTAFMTSIRQMRGQVEEVQARFAIDRARELIIQAQKSKKTGASNNRGGSVQDVGTPWEFIHAVEARFGPIVFDLACTRANAKAPAGYYFDEGVDALTKDWALDHPSGNLWLNPRFSNVAPWAAKCALHGSQREGLISMLTPASVSTEWFADNVEGRAKVLTIRPRITFEGQEEAFPKDLMIVVYGGAPGFETWRWK